MRNREKTQARIIEAVDRIILRDGSQGLGVNAVAQESGVSKVLIYRYFGSFEGLLEAWAVKNSYWTRFLPLPKGEADVLEFAESVLTGQIEDLRSDPVRREVLRWLLAIPSPVGTKVMERLEEAGLSLTREFVDRTGLDGDADVEALFAVITAGINYLALLSDRAPVYNGIRLDRDEGWSRIRDCVMFLLRSAAGLGVSGPHEGAGPPA